MPPKKGKGKKTPKKGEKKKTGKKKAVKDVKKKGVKDGKKKRTKDGQKKKGGKFGKKKVKVKAKSAPAILVTKPEPPPPVYAHIFKYTFYEGQTFLDHIEKMDLDLPMYVLFTHACVRRDPFEMPVAGETRSERALKTVDEYIRHMQTDKDARDINYIIVQLKKRSLEGSVFRSHPRMRIRVLPTFLRWGKHQRLEGAECYNVKLLCLFFENEEKTICPKLQVDHDECLCPFLPPPAPPPTPKTPTKKGKKGKGKGKKGKKGKGKGKKGKVKGKKGKDKGKKGKGKGKKGKDKGKKAKGKGKKGAKKGKKK